MGILDEKHDIVELITTVKPVQKPLRRLFRRCRKQTGVVDFVRLEIDSALQPVFLTVQAHHRLVNGELIRSDRRNRLQIDLVNLLIDRHVAPLYSQPQMTGDTYLDHSPRSPSALHKRQMYNALH
ncbi:Uncharacterized protein HSBGL_2043 [Halapricum desulfuricans]|uniref:Uncharacterized protein n=1 Tax=Halapricum desulfuricans TaxID=2841257 RepID=A0A897NI74_9EURY|nr:Uncharacterized protein HSBGL_2043 [Halapricum desulfuricans]